MQNTNGFSLLTVLALVMAVGALIIAYGTMTDMDLRSANAVEERTTGFYAAETGMNLRGKDIGEIFAERRRPMGEAPNKTQPCRNGNDGSGDMECRRYPDKITERDVITYFYQTYSNVNQGYNRIDRGEFKGLNAVEYSYVVDSEALDAQGKVEANLRAVYIAQEIPVWQFAAFFDQDLSILPGRPMELDGRVHTNSDLILGAAGRGYGSLTIGDQTTAAGAVRRDMHWRRTGQVKIAGRVLERKATYDDADFNAWDGDLAQGVDKITVPGEELIRQDPDDEDAEYWHKADIRVVLTLDNDGNPSGIEVRNADGTKNHTRSNTLTTCRGNLLGNKVVEANQKLYSNREGKHITTLDVDMLKLGQCINDQGLNLAENSIRTEEDGGFVMYLGVDGPDSDGINNYGVRLKNGGRLHSQFRGLTVVSDQATYIEGDYNAVNKKPASIIGDSINILSNAWEDVDVEGKDARQRSESERRAVETTINAGILSGMVPGVDGAYNGGLENYPTFHEDWGDINLNMNTSFVSLGDSKHVNGAHNGSYYTPPTRNWSFEKNFNNSWQLPPLSPRIINVETEYVARDYTPN